MLYSFARVSAVLGMRRQDYYRQGTRGWPRLHEKGGRGHDVPAHHRVAAVLGAYLEAAGLEVPGEALFQSVDRAGERLTGRPLTRRVVLAMIKRRAWAAGLPPSTLLPGADHSQPDEPGLEARNLGRQSGPRAACRGVRTSAIAPLRDAARRDLTEVIEDRAERASTVIASQIARDRLACRHLGGFAGRGGH